MKYHIQGKNSIELSQKDFLAQGGEGSIYVKGGQAFKVYNEPKKMIPLGKIQELSVLTHNGIIKPEDILLNNKNEPVGYSMKFVKDTYALCQLFTKAFRARSGLSPEKMIQCVQSLQEIVSHIHSKQILIVDLNELNFLSSKDFSHIYAIDVDSYQTKTFPATAIMDSIRDPHHKTFTEGTDWYSFAIVSFQMFIGIHPYKGKHPSVKTLEDRMKRNISVLSKDVSIPAACFDFSVIPSAYLDWYRAVFELGKRLPPPQNPHLVLNLVQNIQRITGSDNFQMEELAIFNEMIINVMHFNSTRIVHTPSKVYIGDKIEVAVDFDSQIITTPKLGQVIAASIKRHELKLQNLSTYSSIPITLEADDLTTVDNRLYVKTGTSILEIQFTELDKQIIATTKIVANVVNQSAQMFTGIVIQNLLGSCHLSLFPESGTHYLVKVKELDEYRITDARCEKNVVMITGYRQGQYDKFIIRLAADQFNNHEYDIRKVTDCQPHDLNFIVLDNGICVHLNNEENIEVFSSKKGSSSVNIISDPNITGDMSLFRHGARVFLSKEEKLFSFSMKKKS